MISQYRATLRRRSIVLVLTSKKAATSSSVHCIEQSFSSSTKSIFLSGRAIRHFSFSSECNLALQSDSPRSNPWRSGCPARIWAWVSAISRLLVAPAIHEPISFDLGRRQIVRDVHWHLLEAQLLGGEQPRVTADDDAVFVHNDGGAPAEFELGRAGHLVRGRGSRALLARALRNVAGCKKKIEMFPR
jgi:hypothetical protein